MLANFFHKLLIAPYDFNSIFFHINDNVPFNLDATSSKKLSIRKYVCGNDRFR